MLIEMGGVVRVPRRSQIVLRQPEKEIVVGRVMRRVRTLRAMSGVRKKSGVFRHRECSGLFQARDRDIRQRSHRGISTQ